MAGCTVFLGRRLGTPGRFRWPEGIAKCIVLVGDTAGARTHAPAVCIQGYSRSRDEVVAVTRCARAAEAAHIVLRVLSQNSISVLKPMGAASTAHLLLCHSAVVTLARLSDPHRELPAGGGSQSSQRPAGPVNGRTWLVLDHDVSRGDSTRRAPLTAASSALCA